MMSLANEEDILPTVAFKKRRSIRTLTGLEEIQANQRAGEDPENNKKIRFLLYTFIYIFNIYVHFIYTLKLIRSICFKLRAVKVKTM